MKVGVIVEGRGEYEALPKLQEKTGVPHFEIARVNFHPKAPPERIAADLLKRAHSLVGKGCEKIIVLLDREDRDECAALLAAQLKTAIDARAEDTQCGAVQLAVVLKDRALENWLVADIEAVRSITKRFAVSIAARRSVSNGNADNVNAVALLKKAAKKETTFDKVQDAMRILQKADPLQMAKNSRSFRKFLRELGHEEYKDQSRRPAQ